MVEFGNGQDEGQCFYCWRRGRDSTTAIFICPPSGVKLRARVSRMSLDWSDKQLEELRKLAEARFGHLSAAERKMLEGAIEGDYAYCGPEERKDPHNNPSAAGKWEPDCRIRADLLRWLCIDNTAESLVDLDGIIVQGARIEGALYLSSASIRFPLEFWIGVR